MINFQLTRPSGTGEFALCGNSQGALCRTCSGGGIIAEDNYWEIEGVRWYHVGEMAYPTPEGYYYDLYFDDKEGSSTVGIEVNGTLYWGTYDPDTNIETAIMAKWFFDDAENDWTMIWRGAFTRTGGGSGTYTLAAADGYGEESPPATLERFISGWRDVQFYRFRYTIAGDWYHPNYNNGAEYPWQTDEMITAVGGALARWDMEEAGAGGVLWSPSAYIELPSPLASASFNCALRLYSNKNDSPENDWWSYNPKESGYTYRTYSFAVGPNAPYVAVRYKISSISREIVTVSIADPGNYYPY